MSGEPAVLRFVAPADGEYRVTARFKGIAGPPAGGPVPTGAGYLLARGQTVFSDKINCDGRPNEAAYEGRLTLKKGEVIDAVSGSGNGTFNSDTMRLDLVVTGPDGVVHDANKGWSITSKNPQGCPSDHCERKSSPWWARPQRSPNAPCPRQMSRLGMVQASSQVFTIGYPLVELQGSRPKFTDGKVSSLAGIRDDPDQMQISVAVQPGNSGGPLTDMNGDIVGVIVARLNDLRVMELAGSIPQNVNYAVKGTTLVRFLNENKTLAPGLKFGGAPQRTQEEAIQAVEKASGLVLTYR